MKKITFLILVLLSGLTFSQEEGKFRVSLDLLGCAIPSNGGNGYFINIEPMYNIQDNMSIGLRLGSVALRNIVSDSVEENGANGSIMAVLNYYFNKLDFPITPYIGAGFGYVTNANFINTTVITNNKIERDSKTGGMIRTGFEWKKLKFGLDYNFIPNFQFEYATTKNSYLGISLGVFVGGGKW